MNRRSARKSGSRRGSKGRRGKRGQPAHSLSVRRASDGTNWELVHPACAKERAEDMEEVATMLEAGEIEVAIDELRWLLSGCSDFVEAHATLGTVALAEQNDAILARGHFGYAYQLGLTALRRAGMPRPVPYSLDANRHWFEAGKGLAECLVRLDKPQMAREVIKVLIQCDPTDPLQLKEFQERLN